MGDRKTPAAIVIAIVALTPVIFAPNDADCGRRKDWRPFAAGRIDRRDRGDRADFLAMNMYFSFVLPSRSRPRNRKDEIENENEDDFYE